MKQALYTLIFLSCTLLLGNHSWAKGQAVFGGLNISEFDGSGNFSYELGFDLGYSRLFSLNKSLMFRSGVGLIQRNSTRESNDVKAELSYLQVPVSLYYDFNSKFSGFGGLNFNLKVQDSCTSGGGSCTIAGIKTFVVNFAFGTRYHFKAPHAFEFIYETGLTDMFRNTHLGTSLGVRYLYLF